MKYFTNCRTLDELKKEFRRLAMLNHPDRGGDEETMKAINNEYDAVFPAFRLAYNQAAETPTKETAESTRSEFYTQNGWKGSRYDSSRSLKEISEAVRQFVKEQFPTYKFSVRTKYASMCQELIVDMKEAPCKVYKDFSDLTEQPKRSCSCPNPFTFLGSVSEAPGMAFRKLFFAYSAVLAPLVSR